MSPHTGGCIISAFIKFFSNRKEGIPHRTIMAYTVGSFTIPVLLISIMVMMAINFWLISMHYVISAWVGLGFTFITQIIKNLKRYQLKNMSYTSLHVPDKKIWTQPQLLI